MKVLLGGIPLGCDNIGDEAIIWSVQKMLKESIPDIAITVATADPETAKRLDVAVVPAFGFDGRSLDGFADEVRRHDTYVWCGATGLSDYPNVALDLLEIAQSEGVATFVWGVGMDDELNPAFFRVSGRKKALLSPLGLVGWYEGRLRRRLVKRISRILPRCKGVWLRDQQSGDMLASMGFAGAKIAADTAILCNAGESGVKGDGAKTLGLCISTQRRVRDLDGVRGMIAAVRAAGFNIIGIPMNPKTDRELLGRLGVECIPGDSWQDVCEAAAKCSAVLSSRLHLLILASNVGTPILGIARGSKLANWLSNFGRTVEGGVYDCDWAKVTEHVLSALKDRGDWDAVRDAAYSRLKARFEEARAEFVGRLKG